MASVLLLTVTTVMVGGMGAAAGAEQGDRGDSPAQLLLQSLGNYCCVQCTFRPRPLWNHSQYHRVSVNPLL